MMTLTSDPFLRASSLAETRVIDEVTMLPPPISTRTIAVTWPLSMSTTLPLKMLRALSFMALPSGSGAPGARLAAGCGRVIGQVSGWLGAGFMLLLIGTIASQARTVTDSAGRKREVPD